MSSNQNINNSKVSVIIPAYNSAKFLPEAIDSVLNQTYPVFEIIVVDDGSKDNTKEVCQKYPTVKYIYQTNQGLSGARNAGLQVSTGEYLIFFDSDDCLLPNAVEAGVNAIKGYPEVGFVFGNYIFQSINPDGSYTTQEIYDNQKAIANYENILAGKLKLQVACVLFRRAAVEIVGGFYSYAEPIEDYNFFLRVAREFPIHFHGQTVFEYRYNGGNISGKPAKMLIGALRSHSLQWSYIQQSGKKEYEIAYEQGKKAWIKLFIERIPYEIMKYVQAGQWLEALGYLRLILNYDPKLEIVDREIYEVSYQSLLSLLRTLPIKSSLTYWKQQLAGAPALLSLPTDRPRPAEQNYRGTSQSFVIAQELTQALSLLSKHEGVSLYMTLLAAFDTLLYRYTGIEDIIVGSPIATYVDSQIFVNGVVLRTDMSGNPSFQKLLERVRKLTLLAQAYQDLPYCVLVDELCPQPDPSYSPLFQITYVFEEIADLQKLNLATLTASPWVLENNEGKYDLTLFLKETSDGLEGKWVYNTDLFDADTINRLNGHFQILLEGIIANPQQPISELPILTPQEKQQLLIDWNNTYSDYPQNKCLHQLFEEQVQRTPDKIAVVFADRQLTYQELNSRANSLANYLQGLGVLPDVPVGICIDRSLEMLIGLLGILKAGGTYVPLDPAFPKDRLAYMVSDSQIPVLLTQQDLLDLLPEHQAKVVCLDTDWQKILQENNENVSSSVTVQNLAYIIYTSGSTGKPKGVQLPHGAVTNFLITMAIKPGLTANDVLLAITTISFDIAVLELYLPLILGAKVVIVSREVAVDGIRLLQLIQDSQATIMQATPATWQLLLAAGWEGKSQLKVLCGGEALSPKLASQMLERVASVWNMYGPTEATVWATTYEVNSDTRLDPQKPAILIGKPIGNTETYILDQYLQPVPIGIRGELYIGGVCLAKGYLNREDLTNEKFIRHPFKDKPGDRIYRTGDVVKYLTNGDIEYISRIDNQVKIRGFRIEIGEIEVLLAKHPGIRQLAVIVREDVPGDKRLVAYIVAHENHKLTVNDLRDFLGQNLPQYMIPGAFVTLEALPLTPNGKVDRKALLGYSALNVVSAEKKSENGSSHRNNTSKITVNTNRDTNRITVDTSVSTPRNATEKSLATIWQEILGLEQVGIHDSFFALGGHSLLAMRLFNQIENKFGTRLSLGILFKQNTISQLATLLNKEESLLETKESSPEFESIVMIQEGEATKPPLFLIHAIWGNVLFYRQFAQYLPSDQPVYALQAVGLDGQKAPLTSVSAMASSYIKEMRMIQPQSPYFVGGFSMGGRLAFEIAQQLHDLGEEVKFLAMLDCGAPIMAGSSDHSDNKTIWESSFVHVNNLVKLKLQDQVNYVWDRIKWHLIVGKLNIFYKSYLSYVKKAPSDARLLEIARANEQAIKNHVVTKFYPGKVTVFTSCRDIQRIEDDPQSWDKVATGGVEIHQIPGTVHTTLMEEPNVKYLAEEVNTYLQQAQTYSSASVN